MLALIDGDILRYEIGHASQFKDEDSGEQIMRPYEFTTELLDEKIRVIKEDVEADDALLFLTNDNVIQGMLNKKRKRQGLPPEEVIPNFRFDIAVTKPYKGTRKSVKPLHFNNVTNYMLERYNTYVANTGIEADDAMCIIQSRRISEGALDTIICSRDKDLRICPGNHYSWECGKQRSIGPYTSDRLGFIKLSEDRKKVFGYGLLFFYSQLLTGDTVDNIPGVPFCGSVAACEILAGCEDEVDGFQRVLRVYQDKFGAGAEEYLREQANLLWMVQELDNEGSPVLFRFPKEV